MRELTNAERWAVFTTRLPENTMLPRDGFPPVSPENRRLLDAWGDYLTSVVMTPVVPKDLRGKPKVWPPE